MYDDEVEELFETFRTNEILSLDTIMRADGSLNYILINKEYLAYGEDLTISASFKDTYLDEFVYFAPYRFDVPIAQFLDSLKIVRNNNNQIIQAKHFIRD